MVKTLIALSLLGAMFSCSKPWDNKYVKNVPSDTIKEYEHSYSGTMMWYITWYRIEKGEDGKLRLMYSKDCDPEITIYKCPDDALAKIDSSGSISSGNWITLIPRSLKSWTDICGTPQSCMRTLQSRPVDPTPGRRKISRQGYRLSNHMSSR